MKQKRRTKNDLCIYCGADNEVGRDHIPPKTIFTDTNYQLITVPACKTCNNAASKDDEIFKMALGLHLGHSNPIFSKVARGIKRNNKISQILQRKMVPTYRTNPEGIIEKGVIITIDEPFNSATEKVIIRITKALYYHHYGERITENATYEIRFYSDLKVLNTVNIAFANNQVGNGQFVYLYQRAMENEKHISLWMFEFHKKFWVYCSVKN